MIVLVLIGIGIGIGISYISCGNTTIIIFIFCGRFYFDFPNLNPVSAPLDIVRSPLFQAISWDLRPLCRAMVLQAEKAAQDDRAGLLVKL